MESIDERTVLGAALAEPGVWLAHAARVTPDLFQKHKRIATAICDLTADGKPTDTQSVASRLQSQGRAVRVSDLLELEGYAPLTADSLGVAVDGLHDTAKRSAMGKLAQRIAAQLGEPGTKTGDILSTAFGTLTEIGTRGTEAVKSMSQIMQDVINHISDPRAGGIEAGIKNLDGYTGGFRAGELIVLGARPSMGKTALALGIVRNAAQTGKSIAFFSLEMSSEQICHRLLADMTNINLARITTHSLLDRHYPLVVQAAADANRYRIHVGESAENLGSVCRQIKHRHGLDLVVIDYLQLMSANAQSREQEISTISRRLKGLARQLGCPILVLSQLNRNLEQRANKRPQLSDLRESGAIEQDADLVLLLWRPGYYDPDSDQTQAELIVAKHRNGPTGFVDLVWTGACAKFSQLEKS